MRMVKFMIPFVLALIVCAGTQAAEKEHKLMGDLSAKPADAKAGVVAVLSTHGHKGKDAIDSAVEMTAVIIEM